MHDLLTDPLISIRRARGKAAVRLPELLAALGGGDVLAYPRLRPHQVDPFHVFTVQLAATILAHGGLNSAPDDPTFWRDGLFELADQQASAWQLVVNEPTLPAFMQSPCDTAADFKNFKTKALTPDELDILVTAKDHDLKSARLLSSDAELWLAALITSQTTCGFLGAGNYGVIRMNGGFGSRAIVTTVADTRPGPRFREELPVVLAIRRRALTGAFGYTERGTVLTWLRPWDRTKPQYILSDLDPLFIEAARPIRLCHANGAIQARGATSKTRQIGGADAGDCGDPWTALNIADKKKGVSALTVSARGFDSALVTDLLLQRGYSPTELQQPRQGSGRVVFRAAVLVRGQGTTDGFRSLDLPIPERARRVLIQPDQRDALGTFAQTLLADAATVQRKCLRGALLALAEGGPAQIDYHNDTVSTWINRMLSHFNNAWSHDYFPLLWDATNEGADQRRLRGRWALRLCAEARHVLLTAAQAVPIPANRRSRARARADRFLEGMLHKEGVIDLTKEVSNVITT